MECKDLQELLHRYVDNELPTELRREAETHVERCIDCGHLVQEELTWQQAVRRAGTYYTAPDTVRHHIAVMTRRATLSAAAPRWRGWAMAASLLLAVALSSGVTAFLVAPNRQAPLEQEIVAGHVRSLMADHLTDVVSSDQHTVKPWFHGRLDYAPPVDDLAAQGFPLVGGRLDYLGNRPVAALVYRHAQHPINLYVFPATGADGAAAASVENGYNVLHWTEGSMTYWAVSDLEAAKLKEFETLLRQQH